MHNTLNKLDLRRHAMKDRMKNNLSNLKD